MAQDTQDINDKVREAEEAVKVGVSGIPERRLTPQEIHKLADFVVAFSQSTCGVTLYAYEIEFSWRIVVSLLQEDSEELTALFSRQSGKTETVAVTVCGIAVLFPILANALPHDDRIAKFKNGVWCGIYAPNYEQAGIMWGRARQRMYSREAKEALLDPDINIELLGAENLALPNGSFIDCGTASKQASIEGKTYHLIILEECQDINSEKIRSSIHPMAAATAGTLVKIGTCNRTKSDFYEACRRNKRTDVKEGLMRSRLRRHFEFDYTVAQRYNPRYMKYVTKERERLGEDSDDFRMKYRLHWLLERGMFVNPDMFDECGIKDSGSELKVQVGRGRHIKEIVFTRPPNVVTYDPTTKDIVAAIDVGRENSTVVTVGKVFWDMPVMHGSDERFPVHIYNWLELYGDNHEAQHPQIVEFLKNYKVSRVIVDATGKGDPVYSRLAAELEEFDVEVSPFLFSSASKDLGYKVFHQELTTKRFTFPAGAKASRLQKWQRFVSQMYDLEKTWRGGTMVVSKSKERDAHDDYCDSAMMLCWLVNLSKSTEATTSANPFLGRAAEWMQGAGERFRSTVGRTSSRRTARPSRTGRWD